MRGKLYGIGTGPGDPELLTLKAVKTLKKCDIIALPNAGNTERAAFKIVEEYCAGKTLIECGFSMEKNEEKRKAKRVKAAEDICKILDTGKDVAFVTLGDPTIYSTYMYVHKLVAEKGYETEIIPGIPSFVAAAAALNDSLCEGTQGLYIIPASENRDVHQLLDVPGNKVIMKSGGSLKDILVVLEEKGLKKVKAVERCTMEGERLFKDISELKEAEAGYFSVLIVKE